MPSNPHRPGASAAQSFRRDEIDLLDQLLATVRRGGDARWLIRTDAASRVAKKIQGMKRSLERQRKGGS